MIAAYESWLTTTNQRVAKIEGNLKLLTWMVGFNVAATVGIVFLLVRH